MALKPEYAMQLINRSFEAGIWENEIKLERNEFLKNGGTTDTHLYFVREGVLRLFVMEEEEDHTIRFGYQNNIVAALDSFISDEPSDLYIQAIRRTEVLSVTKEKYLNFMQSDPELQVLWNHLLEMLVFQQMERERDLLISSPKERYNRVLARSPQLFQEVPHKYIANYLRMTPETFSRIHNEK